ncbi:Integrase, catalytic region [Shewanella sp. W3-18-1]|uniref:DNA-binding protein n=1 Tax=Shewanella sp. (strain W3-18-1) TaxID=351745 RepID=UPI00005FDAE9|nr:DNA-binding protein [Shewanella sp. W3-18-1]ABM25750.1 Integrase, catalytic region [Shewanella sp. W3-18-1]
MLDIWLTAKELEDFPELPKTESGVIRRAKREGWICRKREGRGGGFEYHLNSLPLAAQQHILSEKTKAQIAKKTEQAKTLHEKFSGEKKNASKDEKTAALRFMKGWSEVRKHRCFVRFEVMNACESYIRNVAALGVRRMQATRSFVEMFNARSLPFADDIYTTLHGNLSVVSVRRWRKAYQEGGLVNLDSRANPTKDQYLIETQAEMKDYSVAFLAAFPTATAGKLLKAIKEDFKDSELRIPCVRSTRRWMEWWKAKHSNLLESLRNPDAWKNNYLSAFGSASESVHYLNQLWEMDATPADLQVTLPDGSRRRYHITGLIDVYSRAPKLLVTETPRTESNAALLRRAILTMGKPHKVKIDNGSDYVSMGMMAVLHSLDIEYEVCPPFSPWKKPHIERFFRHFSHDLLEMKSGFIGHNVAERKALEARKTFAERLMQKDEVIDVTMTPEELQKFCDDWVNNVYMHKIHSGINATPFEMVSNFKGEIIRLDNERALDMLLSVPTQGGTRTVNKTGIKIDNIIYIAAELGPYIGQQVRILYDKDDLGQIVVNHLSGEFLCIAFNAEYKGIDRAQIAAEARHLQREDIKRAKKEIKAAKRKYKVRDVADRMMASAAVDAGKLVMMPKRGSEFTNPAIEGAVQASDALSQKESAIPPITQEHMDSLRDLMRSEQKQNETEEDRFRRWLDLNDVVQAGKSLDEVNRHWKKNYEATSEYKGRYMVWEDFGDSAFR